MKLMLFMSLVIELSLVVFLTACTSVNVITGNGSSVERSTDLDVRRRAQEKGNN